MVKNLPAMWETPVQFLDQEDPLEKGKATWPGEYNGQSMGSQESDRTERLSLNQCASCSVMFDFL